MKNGKQLQFMKRAMKLAEKGRGLVSPNPVVGSVLVRKGKIIAEDWHRKYGECHAERNLLESFEGDIHPDDVLYVTLEPCCHQGKTPPCTDIILEKGVKKVVVGLLDRNVEVGGRGIQMLRENGVEVEVMEKEKVGSKNGEWKSENCKLIHVKSNILDSELKIESKFARQAKQPFRLENRNSKFQLLIEQLFWQNRFFFTWVTKRRPWVSLKIAHTLDGRIVPERGKQFWLTGEEARIHVHLQRSKYDAILVGLGTVLADDPALTVRLEWPKLKKPKGQAEPKVVILDAMLATPLNREIVRPGTIIFRGRQFKRREGKKRDLEREGVKVLEVDADADGFLNLRQVVDELASQGISSVYVEGGVAVWSSFIRENLVDEFMMYFAPKMLGSGVPTFENLGVSSWKELRFLEAEVLGADVYWHGVLDG